MPLYGCKASGDSAGSSQTGATAPQKDKRDKDMKPEVAQHLVQQAVRNLNEAGIDDCPIVFEGLDDKDRVRPFCLKIGSPSACLEDRQGMRLKV